jgi:hypothetical protein
MIEAAPPRHISTKNGDVGWSEFAQSALFIRDLTLVWDWETSIEDAQDPSQHDALPRTNEPQSQHAKQNRKMRWITFASYSSRHSTIYAEA